MPALCSRRDSVSDLQLVPFGLREEDQEIVDVSEVIKGNKCGCICPSCETPLTARQGDVNQWHFAHITRKSSMKTKDECDFSFFVSVRLMARQVIIKGINIDLPANIDYVGEESPSGEYFSEVFEISSEQTVQLSAPELDKKFNHVCVDILANIKGFPFVIYFSHPNRDTPEELCHQKEKCGVVEIKLDELLSLFQAPESKNKSHKKILSDFLQYNLESKLWLFHPRAESKRYNAQLSLRKTIDIYEKNLAIELDSEKSISWNNHSPKVNIEIPKRIARYECVICNALWEGKDPDGNKCPNCKTHLYSRLVHYIT